MSSGFFFVESTMYTYIRFLNEEDIFIYNFNFYRIVKFLEDNTVLVQNITLNVSDYFDFDDLVCWIS